MQDLTGAILAWNQAAHRIYGWNEKEALKMTAQDRIPAEHYPAEFAKLNKLIDLETLQPYKSTRLTKAGQVVEVWVTATALVDSKNKVYAIATTERLASDKKSLKG
ncbi:MAG: PAS domain-containing protein [Thiomicrorhabdus sp.]|nr:PAS domain-containing protein [Thiomicrorhabdus sp.]